VCARAGANRFGAFVRGARELAIACSIRASRSPIEHVRGDRVIVAACGPEM